MRLARGTQQYFKSNTQSSSFTTTPQFSTFNWSGKLKFSSSSALMNKCLVLAEHNKQNILPTTLSSITAASKISDDINLLIIGDDVTELANKAAQIKGVKKVFFKNSEAFNHLLAEKVSPLLTNIQQKFNFSHIIASTTSNGKNILPRFAASLDVAPISDVLKIVSEDTFVRPIYAGNGGALSVIKSTDNVKVLTVRATGFDKAESSGGNAEISELDVEVAKETPEDISIWISADVDKDKKVELTDAPVVVSGGRGLKNGENFNKYLYALAETFNDGAVGASRGAVDDGYCSNDLQVGQTGKIVAPDLYIAVGISGAIQHLAGMKDSKTIVAINKNDDAPIFQVADYGLVADLFEAVPQLIQALKEKKANK